MYKNSASWKRTLAKCGLLQYSDVKEDGDGHVSITITALVSMEPNASNEQSEEAALEILSECEISAVWATDDGYGLTLSNRRLLTKRVRTRNLSSSTRSLARSPGVIVFPVLICTTSSRKLLGASLRTYSFAIARLRFTYGRFTTPKSARSTSLGGLRTPTMSCGASPHGFLFLATRANAR